MKKVLNSKIDLTSSLLTLIVSHDLANSISGGNSKFSNDPNDTGRLNPILTGILVDKFLSEHIVEQIFQ